MSLRERLDIIKAYVDLALHEGDTPRALRLIREQREIEAELRRAIGDMS